MRYALCVMRYALCVYVRMAKRQLSVSCFFKQCINTQKALPNGPAQVSIMCIPFFALCGTQANSH